MNRNPGISSAAGCGRASSGPGSYGPGHDRHRQPVLLSDVPTLPAGVPGWIYRSRIHPPAPESPPQTAERKPRPQPAPHLRNGRTCLTLPYNIFSVPPQKAGGPGMYQPSASTSFVLQHRTMWESPTDISCCGFMHISVLKGHLLAKRHPRIWS